MTVSSYEAAGVSVEAGDRFAQHIKRLTGQDAQAKLLPALGGYAAVYPLSGETCVALTTDGVGTKVLLAEKLQQFNTVGIDLVAMCANDLICVGARPTLFLDYYATGKLDEHQAKQIIDGILTGCLETGMLLAGGETAEMPDVYTDGHFDLAGFAMGVLNKADLRDGSLVRPGQVLIGLPSSGIHSNGLSLARKILTDDADLCDLMTPTQLYVKPVMAALDSFGPSITGMAHITGGGWRNLLRMNKTIGFDITTSLPVPPIFDRLAKVGDISAQEMYETFNMGLGFALTVSPEQANEVVTTFKAHGMGAAVIGVVTPEAGVIHVEHLGLSFKEVLA